MLYRILGSSGLKVSVIGYGAWKLAGRGWPGVNLRDAERAFSCMIDNGVNLADTAPVYGFGASEEALGRMLSGRRHDVMIATKCGLVWNERGAVSHDLSAASIRRECEASLRRLRTDYIDLYQTHWPDPATPFEETYAELVRLSEEGKIRHIGVCNVAADSIGRIRGIAPIVSVQAKLNYLERSAMDGIIPACTSSNCGFIAYSPLAQGLLSSDVGSGFVLSGNDVRRMNPLFTSEDDFRNAVEKKKELGADPARKAISFVVNVQGVTSALVSVTRIVHADKLVSYDFTSGNL
jgi:aryl-alcohol dehydrogenase-like predicted oxidoreductase